MAVGKPTAKAQIWTFLVTFTAFASLHLVRKAFSNSKTTLRDHDQETFSTAFLGQLDTVFLLAYASGLYMSGMLGDMYDERWVATVGLLGTAATVSAFGFFLSLGVTNRTIYSVLWICNGAFQSTGWPTGISIMEKWFPEEIRGKVMGVWGANGCVGNVLGAAVATVCLHFSLQSSFSVPSIWLVAVASLVGCTLRSSPPNAAQSLAPVADEGELAALSGNASTPVPTSPPLPSSPAKSLTEGKMKQRQTPSARLDTNNADVEGDVTVHQEDEDVMDDARDRGAKVSFLTALLVPGVIRYSFCYLCLKLVTYLLFFWLPFYIEEYAGYGRDAANMLSTLFDVGFICGGIAAGWLSDRTGYRSMILFPMLVAGMPSLYGYHAFSTFSLGANAFLMTLSGFMLGGPSAMLSTVVSQDLGTHPALGKNASAVSTIAGIVDGTGSIGAALEGVVVALVVSDNETKVNSSGHSDQSYHHEHGQQQDWGLVFRVMVLFVALSAMLIAAPAWNEWKGEEKSKKYLPVVESDANK